VIAVLLNLHIIQEDLSVFTAIELMEKPSFFHPK